MIASSCIRAGAESVQGKGYGENKEFKVQGAFGSKDCDITIFDKESKPISVIAVKFPITNYKQNSNNYFESSMGETANLQLAGVSVNQAIFLPYQMPYLNKAGEIIKMEKITDSDISKYRKLLNLTK